MSENAPVLEDRLQRLQEQNAITGVDFVRVVEPCEQTRLWVYFYVNPATLSPAWVLPTPPLVPDPDCDDCVLIESIDGGESLNLVPIESLAFVADPISGRTVLQIDVAEAGDFSNYRLSIRSSSVDTFFNNPIFSFKQGCEVEPGFDCAPAADECPPLAAIDIDIDYLARDYQSLKRALLDFAAQRYPSWVDGSEADLGVLILELYAALGDELSYTQDRYFREGFLNSATQRRSVRQLARLVDYQISDGRLASTHLSITVMAGLSASIIAGSQVWAESDDQPSEVFEVGRGLADGSSYPVDAEFNEMQPYLFDESQRCLPAGSNCIYVCGTLDESWIAAMPGGRMVVLRPDPTNTALPQERQLLEVVDVRSGTDPLILDGGLPSEYTKLIFAEGQLTQFEFDLVETVVLGNIVPASAGETLHAEFTIGPNSEDLPTAVERQGPLGSDGCERPVTYLFSLPGTEGGGLGFMGEDLHATVPEVMLTELPAEDRWTWRRSLLDARGTDESFTLDDGTWREIVKYDRGDETIVHRDYASGEGFTLRFGDGEFGKLPASPSTFRADYRLGPGVAANLPPDAIGSLAPPPNEPPPSSPPVLLPPEVEEVTNPLAVSNGVDPETFEEIRLLVPEAWKAQTLRAVRPEDYAKLTEELPWVQRANACARWTGSWLTNFVTPDPRGTFELSEPHRDELEDLMDCVRQVGKEVFVREPKFVPIDLEITVCVSSNAFRGAVARSVLDVLTGTRGSRPKPGFFSPDNFTFGTPLRRAALEAAIQSVSGVRAVEGMRIRARNVQRLQDFDALNYAVADNEVIRLDNNPRTPERGVLKLVMEGGA